MKISHCLGIGIISLVCGACTPFNMNAERGSGRVTTEQRSVTGITGVNLATSGRLFIEVGDAESLRVQAEDNLVPYIKTEVRGGTLNIQAERNRNFQFTRPVEFYLTVKNLNSIMISSSGDVQAPNLKADHFSVIISSSGNLRMGDLQAEEVAVNISSSGDVSMGVVNASRLDVHISSSGDLSISGGEVKQQNIILNSSGDYSARNLASDEAVASLNSSGDATIRVRNQLTANLNSSGDLRYLGSPLVNLNKNSSGDVVRLGN